MQKTAFTQSDLLVIYGSSELLSSVHGKEGDFFEEYPTGFRAFPVGKQGAASLPIMQKIASLGHYIEGRKVAFTISPGYFLSEKANVDYYDGNFSALQATEFAFSTHLSGDLKRTAARRMINIRRRWMETGRLILACADSPAAPSWTARSTRRCGRSGNSRISSGARRITLRPD